MEHSAREMRWTQCFLALFGVLCVCVLCLQKSNLFIALRLRALPKHAAFLLLLLFICPFIQCQTLSLRLVWMSVYDVSPLTSNNEQHTEMNTTTVPWCVSFTACKWARARVCVWLCVQKHHVQSYYLVNIIRIASCLFFQSFHPFSIRALASKWGVSADVCVCFYL